MKLLPVLALLFIAPILGVSATGAQTSSSLPPAGKLDLREATAMDLLLYAPRPKYPYEARRAHILGSGIAQLTVNPDTGEVSHAFMEISTGSTILDEETLRVLRSWKFKTHSVVGVKVPINFTLGGASYTYQKLERPLAEILAPYLGVGAVRKARVPEYPNRERWTFKRGQGRYEIHVDATGHVTSVLVLQSSGDPIFDQAAKTSLGKWQLNRGPLVVELPLSFVLTPDSYRVDVAR